MHEPRQGLKLFNARSRTQMILTLTDAIEKFGNRMTTEELQHAYEEFHMGNWCYI